MKIIKGKFGRLVQKVSGGFISGTHTAGGSDAAAANKGWIAVTILVAVASIALCFFTKLGIGVENTLGVVWGLFIGVSMLIYWPQKLLTTIFGGTLGVAGAGLPGFGDTIEKLAQGVQKIVTTLNASMTGIFTVHTTSVILFLVFLLIGMIPAYTTSDN